ncbi:DinB family protein [Streptomyces sp. URMC 123]|uniref:DinB family protein n=1 Tax=Streptomyces sp. URMC 123 TaxID=3423403 RepID=UPI003F1BD84A
MAPMTTEDLTSEQPAQPVREIPAGLIEGERPMLEAWLDFQRETLALKCAGLDDTQLREAAAPPSELTLLGLLRHMTDVERSWFRRTMAGRKDTPPIYYTDEDPDGDFRVTDADTGAATLERWRAEVAACREAVAGLPLDTVGASEHRLAGPVTLRWVYVHMIEEYARHNGHADLLRERIDGSTGF